VPLFTFRGNQWQLLLSDQLVPGDLVSVTSSSSSSSSADSSGGREQGGSSEEVSIPCDVLLIRGSCVANEAMLTGESVPQIKESLRSLFDDVDEEGEGEEGGRGEGREVSARKQLLQRVVDLGEGTHSNRDWDRHVLFSGTTVSQHTETLAEEESLAQAGGGGGKSFSLGFGAPRAPDKGCQGIVMRTSFGTCQGGLMRTILYSSERVTTSSSSFETFLFIGMLLVFALVASGVVLRGGLYDENRNKFKLVLHCIMIITSVVPPELPMELSLAVTTSLAALIKNHIYCTEAYRINFAGKVSMLCFDKTGTLTQDKMVLRGMVDPQDLKFDGTPGSSFTSAKTLSTEGGGAASGVELEMDEVTSPVKLLLEPDECADLVLTAMAACQSLITSKKGSILGDPLEVETFHQAEFSLLPGAGAGLVTSVMHAERGLQMHVLKRYPFSSVLKRMSVVASVSSPKHGKHQLVCCKGAPEVVQKFLTHVPANYVATYQLHMALGRRVIALAYKSLGAAQAAGAPKSRAATESELTFLSFLVFDSSLKSDTKSVMKDLRHTRIPMMMITGDSPFTAADIGQKLYITKKDKPSLVLDVKGTGGNQASTVVWRRALSASEQLQGAALAPDTLNDAAPLVLENLARLKEKYNLIVTGGALSVLERQEQKQSPRDASQAQSEESVSTTLQALSSHVQIFARTSPQQKEQVLWALNKAGFITLMCGDGESSCVCVCVCVCIYLLSSFPCLCVSS
jgi:manganese-transporting P-type ATPase